MCDRNMVGHKLGEFSATRVFKSHNPHTKIDFQERNLTSKYMRISPKKERVALIYLKAAEAVEILKYIPRKAARMFDKTLESAMANAENNSNLSADDLYICGS